VKKLLAYRFGVGYEITTMPSSSSAACQSLKVLGDKPFVAVSIGEQEGDETKKKGKKSTKLLIDKKSSWAHAEAVFPVCMALRPCGESSSTLGKAVTFGFYSETGIPVAVVSGVKFTFYGLAFSSTGQLVPPTLSPSLFNDVKPAGMHVWMKGEIGFPLKGKGKAKIGKVALTGEFGVYAELGGHADFVPFLKEPIEDSSDLMSMITKFAAMSQTGRYQIFGALQLELELNLKKLCNLNIGEFKVNGTASVMMSLDWQLTGMGWNAKLALYAGRTATFDLMQLISAQLGPFGELIKKSVKLDMSMTQRIYMAFALVASRPEFHFGADFEVSVKMDCGPINDLGQTIRNLPEVGEKIYKAVWPEAITAICGETNTMSARISFGWKGFALDRASTYLELKANAQTFKVSVADLPICPPGGSIGDSCSANSDCYSVDTDNRFAGYTQGTGKTDHNGKHGGYCLNHKTFKTSIGCTGKCIKLREVGESCDANELNVPLNLAHSAEDEACKSGKCLCGSCVENNLKLPNEKTCATNDNCSSDWCEKAAGNTACTGKCKPRRATGTACYNDDGNSCSTGQCTCGFCGNKLPNEKTCATNDNCDSNWCEKAAGTTACNGECKPKKNDFSACYNDDANSCISETCTCNTCAGRRRSRLPNRTPTITCATNANCVSGWCEGGGGGCHGECKPTRKSGTACYSGDGESCEDGQCTCGICGKKHIGGKKCSTNDNCVSPLGCNGPLLADTFAGAMRGPTVDCAGTCDERCILNVKNSGLCEYGISGLNPSLCESC